MVRLPAPRKQQQLRDAGSFRARPAGLEASVSVAQRQCQPSTGQVIYSNPIQSTVVPALDGAGRCAESGRDIVKETCLVTKRDLLEYETFHLSGPLRVRPLFRHWFPDVFVAHAAGVISILF